MDTVRLEEELTRHDLEDLARAKEMLESPGLAARLANVVGAPLERGFEMLPPHWSELIQRATRAALMQALKVAVDSVGRSPAGPARNFLHKVLVGTSGGLFGAFGIASLPIELPVSTALMMRSIADIARSEGHDLRLVDTQVACLEVYALGGRSPEDDAVDNAYWMVRLGMAKAVSDAATYLARRGAVHEGAPAVVAFISRIASRFGLVVSQQMAAKAVPLIGAATGSAVNVVFINHFQTMAKGHFMVKRLEKHYGVMKIREVYESLPFPGDR